jgi:long-chain fatty acid transport protein
MRNDLPVSAFLVATLLSLSSARAGGFGVAEFGARRTAMAAVVGRPDEPSAVFHNPAGLALLPGVRLYASLGLSLIDTEFRLKPWDGSDRFLDEPIDGDGYYPATEPRRAFGVIPMLVASLEILPGRLWGAASLYVSNGTGARFAKTDVTRYHLIDGYIVSPLGSLSAAYQVSPALALGAGVGLMNVRIHGRRLLFPILMGVDLSDFFGPRTEITLDGSAWVPTWNLGALGAIGSRLTVGASLVGKIDAETSGDIVVVASDGGVFEGTQSTSLLLPWTFLVGANLDVSDHLELGAELRYWLYRQYDRQVTDVEGIILVDQLVTEKNYRDSWALSGGGRLHGLAALPGLELMLGLHYDRTPAPRRTVSLDQPSFNHIGLHTGVRWEHERWRLGASYIHQWYDVPDVDDSITTPPSNMRGSGGNDIFTASLEVALGEGAIR